MKEYTVKTVSSADCWDEITAERLEECAWSPNPAPGAQMQGIYLKDQGLIFRLRSFASPARAENWEPDSAVWEDSCLECFLSFDGERYINLEVNANSALRASVGKERHGRTLLLDTGCEMPQVSAVEGENGWEVYFFIPNQTVRDLFGIVPESGMNFFANFYSCGDETPAPHYAAWNRVETEQPDFHRPEYFGRLVIE